MVAQIVGEETMTSIEKKTAEPATPPAEASTNMSAQVRSEPEAKHKDFPRVTSANQMVLFPVEEEGPKIGQISRAVATDPLSFPFSRKDIFYVYSETNPEEEYKGKVDYTNLVLLRAKLSSQAVESLPAVSRPIPRTISAPVLSLAGSSGSSIFNFQDYSLRILMNQFER